jgi:hypothetical protein
MNRSLQSYLKRSLNLVEQRRVREMQATINSGISQKKEANQINNETRCKNEDE